MHFAHWSRSGITSLIKTLTRSKNDSFVLLLTDEDFEDFYEGIYSKISLRFNKWRFFKSVKLLRNFYVQQNPHIVHAHSFTPFLLACLLCTRSKLVLHVHNEYPYLTATDLKSRFKRACIKLCFFMRDVKVITVTKNIGTLLAKNFRKSSTFVPNGIPDQGTKRPDFIDLTSRNRLFSVCRIEQQKNLEMAIDIIELVSEKQNVSYHIYGDGPQKDDLVRLVESKKLQEIIIFKGFCEKPEFLCEEYDFYFSCSTYEGLSLSVANALRGGNVVVMTPVGELKNYINNWRDGVLIGFDVLKAAEKVEALLSMENEDLALLQKSGRRLYENNFTEFQFLGNIDSIYNEIVN